MIGPQGIASECHFTLTRLNSLTPLVGTNFLGSAAAAQNQINNSSAVTTLTGEYFFLQKTSNGHLTVQNHVTVLRSTTPVNIQTGFTPCISAGHNVL